jgi:thioesterase domain-containing protein
MNKWFTIQTSTYISKHPLREEKMRSNPNHSLLAHIAPAQAMQISVTGERDGQLTLAAPLGPNLNDKGTGFAGSISSLLVLAGWGVITLTLQKNQLSAEVLAAQSQTDYLAPVRGTLQATALLSKEKEEDLLRALQDTGRGSISIESTLESEGVQAARMSTRYVVRLRPSKS